MTLVTTFDLKQAAFIKQEGTGEIKGEAFLRQNGGGVVTCAGREVTLVPSTAYSDERFLFLFKNNEKGYSPVYRRVISVPNPEYASFTRKTRCDSQGKFKFTGLQSGNYYVAGDVIWVIGGLSQGGSLMQKVNVNFGQASEALLTQ